MERPGYDKDGYSQNNSWKKREVSGDDVLERPFTILDTHDHGSKYNGPNTCVSID